MESILKNGLDQRPLPVAAPPAPVWNTTTCAGLNTTSGDGRYPRLLAALAKTDLIALDDWGIAPLTDEQRRDLLELLVDRHGLRSTLVAAQLSMN